MAKLKTQRLSKAEAEQIGMSKNLDKKDEEAKAAISKLGFRSFLTHCRNSQLEKNGLKQQKRKRKAKHQVKR